jgi:hypothetical protein
MYLFIVFCYPHHYKTFAIATSNTIGGHLGKGKNVQVGIKAVYLTLRLFYFHVTGLSQRLVRKVPGPGGLPPTRVRFLTGEFCHQNDVILMKSAKTLLLTL